MTTNDDKLEKQLAAARRGMDKYRVALSALAGNEESSEAFQRKLEIARERMKKYHVVYQALAK